MRESIPLACSLSATDLVDRRLEFAEVASSLLSYEPTEDGARFHFSPSSGFAARLADLTTREKECCPFFEFRIEDRGDEIVLEVAAPPEARPIVASLFAVGAG